MTRPIRCAILAGLVLVLTGCPETYDAIYCYGPDEPDGPAVCEERYEACIQAALDAHDADAERIGAEQAGEAFVGQQAACSDGWHACVAQHDAQGVGDGEGEL